MMVNVNIKMQCELCKRIVYCDEDEYDFDYEIKCKECGGLFNKDESEEDESEEDESEEDESEEDESEEDESEEDESEEDESHIIHKKW